MAESLAKRPPTVVVADDDAGNRELLTACLERRGFRVLAAADGREALEVLESEPVDLILLDIVMPHFDGIEVLKIVRRRAAPWELPVIMVTAMDDSAGIVQALDLGANDYVTKPVDLSVIAARVRAHLGARGQPGPARARFDPLTTLTPGTVIEDRYRIEEEIGRGAFSIVYRANHLNLDLPVVIKVLHAGLGVGAGQLERFRREGSLTGRLRHPNAVAVLDSGVTAEGLAFLVMELLEGESLAAHLRRKGALPAGRGAELLAPVCGLLAHAHSLGMIHRDVKPGNIFLHRGTAGETVKVFDFGLVKLIGEAAREGQITQEGALLGTLVYMAPELFIGEPAGEESDIYAVGVTLFETLVGRPAFDLPGATPLGLAMMHLREEPRLPEEVAARTPPEMRGLLVASLAKEPARRPTAAEMERTLSGLAEAAGQLPPVS